MRDTYHIHKLLKKFQSHHLQYDHEAYQALPLLHSQWWQHHHQKLLLYLRKTDLKIIALENKDTLSPPEKKCPFLWFITNGLWNFQSDNLEKLWKNKIWSKNYCTLTSSGNLLFVYEHWWRVIKASKMSALYLCFIFTTELFQPIVWWNMDVKPKTLIIFKEKRCIALKKNMICQIYTIS